jgi:hypothetical protein
MVRKHGRVTVECECNSRFQLSIIVYPNNGDKTLEPIYLQLEGFSP